MKSVRCPGECPPAVGASDVRCAQGCCAASSAWGLPQPCQGLSTSADVLPTKTWILGFPPSPEDSGLARLWCSLSFGFLVVSFFFNSCLCGANV